ncbi:MAG TPA: tetratricopeptide repeat protein [Flavobacteriales bacterium]|nr:tetratricopeptide repeat protein [Flavobacteriales bacterium]
MLKKLFFGLLIVAGLSACTTSSVLVNIQRPADITVSQDIQNVVVVNRSRPSKDNLAGNIVEGLISGEGIGADRKGAEYCVDGLVNMLTNSERFTLKNIDGIELKGTGTSAFPIPLDWNEVKSLCGSYDSDALLVLETFDSDSWIRLGAPVTRTRKVKKIKIKELRYPAILTMNVESGWRIYDVNKKQIIDENKFTEVKEFTAWGNNPEEAQLNLPSKRRAIQESGLFAGKQYGFRISPMWIKVSRTYYTGKSDDLKLAKSYVKSGDWDAAIEIWKDLVNNPDDKIARRSAYNMAIASEIKGGLDTAIEWASKSEKLGEKKAYRYINVLHIRKKNEEKLKQQLNN